MSPGSRRGPLARWWRTTLIYFGLREGGPPGPPPSRRELVAMRVYFVLLVVGIFVAIVADVPFVWMLAGAVMFGLVFGLVLRIVVGDRHRGR